MDVGFAVSLQSHADLLASDLRKARDELARCEERLAAHEARIGDDYTEAAVQRLFERKGVGLSGEQRRRRSERVLREWDES